MGRYLCTGVVLALLLNSSVYCQTGKTRKRAFNLKRDLKAARDQGLSPKYPESGSTASDLGHSGAATNCPNYCNLKLIISPNPVVGTENKPITINVRMEGALGGPNYCIFSDGRLELGGRQ